MCTESEVAEGSGLSARPGILALSCLLLLLLDGQASLDARHLYDSTLSYHCLDEYSRATSMGLGDLNQDGHLDAVLATDRYGGLSVVLGHADGTFDPTSSYPFGNSSQTSVALGDLDLDGDLDAVATCIEWDDYAGYGALRAVAVLLGHGDGQFDWQPVFLPIEYSTPDSAVLGDLNGDGDLDLAFTDMEHDRLFILRGQQGAGLSEPSFCSTGEAPTRVRMADLDGDGDLDLVTANLWGETVSVLLGNADGTFAAASEYPAGGAPNGILVADLNGDADLDLAMTHYFPQGVSLLLGNGDGTFVDGQDLEFDEPADLLARDPDGDGDLDLIVAATDVVRILQNDGSGAFSAGGTYPANRAPSALGAGDFDGDGDLDLCEAGGYFLSPEFSVLLNRGNATFPASVSLPMGDSPGATVLGDLDGDGDQDLVARGHQTLWVQINEGGGTFATPQGYECSPCAVNYVQVALGDLDGDGVLDVLESAGGVFLGNGDGTFIPLTGFSPVGFALALGDIDDDGDPDMLIGDDYRVTVLLGNGDGTFVSSGVLGVEYEPEIALGHIDEDSCLDAVVVDHDDYGYCRLWSWLGDGNGDFTEAEHLDIGYYGGAVVLSDLDDDGSEDAVVAEFYPYVTEGWLGRGVETFWGRGDGTFMNANEWSTGMQPTSLLCSDLDGDGDTDLAVTNERSNSISLLLNQGSRVFSGPFSFTCGKTPESAAAGDLDGDGDLDLVTGNIASDDISILFNSSNLGFIATGPGRGPANPPLVRLFDPPTNGAIIAGWNAYSTTGQGVNVALGDLDGTGDMEVLTGPGPGSVYSPHVRGFQADGTPLPGVSFQAYGTRRYGVNVACGDIDADGFDEILTGPGPGPVFGPHVRGWSWDGAGDAIPIPGLSFLAYGTHRWGVNVACGDLDADGFDEIVTGPGPAAVFGPHVRGWDWDGAGSASPLPGVSFLAYGTHQWGVNVACGDIDADGFDEILTGAGPGEVFAPHVRGWDWDGAGSARPIPGVSFIAYNSARWGVNVSCGDLDGDGIDEILTGRGPGPIFPALVRGWNYDGVVLAAMPGVDFFAYDPVMITYGVKVAGVRAGR